MQIHILENAINNRIKFRMHQNHVRSMLHAMLEQGAHEMVLVIDEYSSISYEFVKKELEFTKGVINDTIF